MGRRLRLAQGFPSSFIEHLDVLPLLTDPSAHGGLAEDAFDVVITSLPGYGFSDPLGEPMLVGVTIQLGLRHPDDLIGIHLSAFFLYPPPEPRPSVAREFIESQKRERAEVVAYSRMQSTKPQTVAYGLTDSPAGLAAWIVDLFRAFSDCRGELGSRFIRDQLLTNLTIYWVTSSIGSSMRG